MKPIAIAKAMGRLGTLWTRDALSSDNHVSSLSSTGIVVIPDFLRPEKCDLYRNKIDELIDANPETIWAGPLGADHRIFGANRLSEEVNEFFSDPSLTRIVCNYLKSDSITGYTMANRVSFKEGNKGSGQGWHRDSAGLRDMKAIVYLCDVTEKNGPFQYWKSSHNLSSRINVIRKYGTQWRSKRFSQDAMGEEIEKQKAMVTAIGTKGTLILTETCGIHRGCPIVEGTRYAFTNYYWKDKSKIPEKMLEIAHGRDVMTIQPQPATSA